MNIINALDETGKATREYLGQNRFIYLLDGDFHKDDGDGQGGFVYCNIDLLDNNWQPYHEEKEIRPERPGETWEYDVKALKIFTFTNSGLGLSAIDETGQVSTIPPFMVHGKRGFTRIEPPVEEVWGKSAIQNDKYEAAQIFANEVARRALEFLDEIKDKP